MNEFASVDDAIEWAVTNVDDPCVDNIRFSFIDDDEAMNKYGIAQDNGCCGFFDEEVIVNGKPAIVGCNYGH